MGIIFLALSLSACAATPKDESAGEFLDNSVVTGKVKSAYLGDPKLKSFNITVETYKGTVQLSGFVNTQDEKKRAEDLARLVEGVHSVKNNINVK
jgi:osmotically-inducible protein OsmY